MAFSGRTLQERLRSPYQRGAGLVIKGLIGMDNGNTNPLRVLNSNATAVADMIGKDSFNRDMVLASYNRALRKPMVFNMQANAAIVSQRFFIADEPMEIIAISCSYSTADGATNTAVITKEVTGQAPGAGVTVMTNTFNLNTTTNTAQWATLPNRDNPGYFGTGEPLIAVNTGEMLSFKIASAVTSLAGLIITVYALPQSCIEPAVWNMQANASLATQAFYLSNRYLTVTGVQMVWSAAGTDAGAVTIDVTHETGTTAPGSGNSILSAAQSAKGTANAPVSVALNATASRLLLAPGDRLSVKFTGTLTALAGVVVVVSFANASVLAGTSAPQQLINPTFWLQPNSLLGTNQAFFGPAEADLEVYDISAVWSTAGGGGTVTVTSDASGTAPGAGNDVLSADLTNSGTANTVLIGTKSVSKRIVLVPAGGLLSVKFASTLGSLAGLVISATLASPGC